MNDYYRGYVPSYLSGGSNTNIVWVMGQEGAKAYPIMPGRTLLLMDSENAKFYIKSTDMNGYTTMRTFSFVEELPVAAEPVENTNNYITREQLEEILAARLPEKPKSLL